jgi:2-polyprenyl-3-methyl-5-hydroxy-6-metoxy-1,4-benzoquinol methylase
MDVKQAYNIWADQYDTNKNKTRDLEAKSLRKTLTGLEFEDCLEIGCGTGKNTEYLITKSNQVTALDLSDRMIAKAMLKIKSDNVKFIQADITKDWTFATKQYDLVIFSLVLEHIEDLNAIFKKASCVLKPNGLVYIGELHPYKQYSGSKATFETEKGEQIVRCFNHHISDFTQGAKKCGSEIEDIGEFFDDNKKTGLPRIITLLLRKSRKNTSVSN